MAESLVAVVHNEEKKVNIVIDYSSAPLHYVLCLNVHMLELKLNERILSSVDCSYSIVTS